DHNLHPDRSRNLDEHHVGGDREKDTEAEHFKRLLTALDHRLEDGPLQSWPVARHESRNEESKDYKMEYAVGRKIGLVIGVERVDEPGGHPMGKLGESPRHRHHQRENKV